MYYLGCFYLRNIYIGHDEYRRRMPMPSIILAPIKITEASGEVTFGDVLQITPKSTSKTYSGSGGSNTGDFMNVLSIFSMTNTIDPDASDSNNQGNN